MKIGLIGGTFDPPHNAHLALAAYTARRMDLQKIYFIPSAQHPLKKNSLITPVNIRYRMLESALHDHPDFAVSRIEIDRNDVSYTIDTLRQFPAYENIPDAEMYLILGMDNINELHLWKDPELILQLAKIVVFRRPGAGLNEMINKFRNNLLLIDAPMMDISSTAIRAAVKAGKDVSTFLAPGVIDIIYEHRLYI